MRHACCRYDLFFLYTHFSLSSTGKPHLLLKHLPVCYNQPAEVRAWAQKGFDEWRNSKKRPASSPAPNSGSAKASGTASGSSQSSGAAPKQSSFAIQAFPRVSINEQVKLEQHVMRFFAACNVSFQSVEHPEFVAMVKAMRGTSYNPPTRKRLSSDLLPELFVSLQKAYFDEVRGACGTLSIDGWTDAKSDCLVGIGLSVHGNEYLVELRDTAEQHTAGNLFPVVLSKLRDLASEAKCRVGTVVSDNAANMENTRVFLVAEQLKQVDSLKLVAESLDAGSDKHNVWIIIGKISVLALFSQEVMRQVQDARMAVVVDAYGCSAHLLNLIGQDLADQNVLNKVCVMSVILTTIFFCHRFWKWQSTFAGRTMPAGCAVTHKLCVLRFRVRRVGMPGLTPWTGT